MNLSVFAQSESRCQACGLIHKVPVKYCEAECIADGHGGFIKSQTVGRTPEPHLHATCGQCGHEWLTWMWRRFHDEVEGASSPTVATPNGQTQSINSTGADYIVYPDGTHKRAQ